MSLAPLAPPNHRAYTYKVTIPPAEFPVTLEMVKEFLKLDPSDDSQDDLLNMFIGAATIYAEKLTKRDFIERTYETFRDFFPRAGQNEGYYPFGLVPSGASGISYYGDNVGYEIRRSPLVSVTDIAYTDSNQMGQTVASTVYYNTVETDYSEVLTVTGQCWPDDALRQMQNIKITFIAGMAPDAATFLALHPNLVNALLMHIAKMYENRGDCSEASCACACATTAPSAAHGMYLQCQIINI